MDDSKKHSKDFDFFALHHQGNEKTFNNYLFFLLTPLDPLPLVFYGFESEKNKILVNPGSETLIGIIQRDAVLGKFPE